MTQTDIQKQPTRRALLGRVRKTRAALELVATLAFDALAYADRVFRDRPQDALVRLAVTAREIAAQLPQPSDKQTTNKEGKSKCKTKK